MSADTINSFKNRLECHRIWIPAKAFGLNSFFTVIIVSIGNNNNNNTV